jgi:hypothetical protein
MKISDALNQFCNEFLNDNNDWYNWKINESKIPDGIRLPNGNQYIRNIALKHELHRVWASESDITNKGNLIQYYIKDWGGIRTNSNASMENYMLGTSSTLIGFGEKGISSWSKALVVHNPHVYAIFDARVSTSLNCLQIIYDIDKKELFPILASRNKEVAEGQRLIKRIAKENSWKKVSKDTFYHDYLALLKKVAEKQNTDLSTVEMLLFAKAEELVKKIKNFA